MFCKIYGGYLEFTTVVVHFVFSCQNLYFLFSIALVQLNLFGMILTHGLAFMWTPFRWVLSITSFTGVWLRVRNLRELIILFGWLPCGVFDCLGMMWCSRRKFLLFLG